MTGRTWTIGENGEVEITYYLNARLASISFSEEATDKQVEWIFNAMAMKANNIGEIADYMKSIAKKVKVKEVPPDISFERFWKEYGWKYGRIEAEKAWNRLSMAEKVLVLVSIKKYKAFNARKSYDPAYASKYINKGLYKDFQ